ncbi:MAG: 1-acyl-sn-glycerol-3-phosphate acyltransferase [Rhodospirillales bacterium]|nr:1-acyl-sn-glycerol-3-phosphate acyltransferase [Rhodospirillales bacterium]MCB9973131.1 1-acyl-sn-glycerol-3-phosphate acyltransferase [Rhodospirillales bacterium]
MFVIAILKIILFLLWCCIMVPVQMVVLIFHKGLGAYTVPKYWHKGVCVIFGVKVKISGTPVQDRQIMYVSNHLSYLDVPAIGSYLKASFIAKQEVAGWPVFGFLSKLQQTAFIDRSGARVDKDHYDLGSMLDAGKSLILFPEGTSSDGQTLLPFKSRLFTLVIERVGHVAVQPFTIRLPQAKTQEDRDRYAWYGDMDLAPHLWALAKTGGVTVELVFHDLIEVTESTERKVLTEQCYQIIQSAM